VEELGRESLDLGELGKVHTYYQTVLTEILYYFLRHDLGRGFRAYYRFSHESIMARDMLMDLQLQAELLSYLSRPPAPIFENDITIKTILERLKTRAPARAWALGKYDSGITEVHRSIVDVEQDWRHNYPLLLAELHVWAASLHILRGASGDQEEGEKHLEKVYELLSAQEIDKPLTNQPFIDSMLWYAKVVMALAHRVHGYLKRVQGFMKEAVNHYRISATLLREIDLRIEMATTMNDMGFAQAEMGLWADGRANVKNALELRRELGPRIPVALSLNTLAAIDVREGSYDSARQTSQKALAIFRAFSHQRGTGLALLTLAEATRRFARIAPLLSDSERVKSLREARDYAREARIIFSESDEATRRVEALIEIGTACRDWVSLLKKNPQAGDSPARLRQDSRDALAEAAKLAKEGRLTYRQVDALVNLAWLEYYLLDEDEDASSEHPITDVIQDAEEAFPSDIEIQKQPQVWAQMGKLYVLKGHLAVRKFEQQRKIMTKGLPEDMQQTLRQVAENYALSLDFSVRFEDDYQGIRRSKDDISDQLKLLNASEMRVVCNHVQSLYPNGSVMQEFLSNRALWQTG
jgi:tetratricopeptide (TPR) repeat protein